MADKKISDLTAETDPSGGEVVGVKSGETVRFPADQLGSNVPQPEKVFAWVQFDGTTSPPSILDSYNIDSVSKNSTGRYTVSFSTSAPSSDYVTLVTGKAFAHASRDTTTIDSAQFGIRIFDRNGDITDNMVSAAVVA